MNRLVTMVLLAAGLLAWAPTNAAAAILPAQFYTIATWDAQANNQVRDQDKLYTFIGSNLPTDVPVTFQTLVQPGYDEHTVKFFDSTANYILEGPGTFFVDYSVEVVPAASALFLTNVTFDLDVNNGQLADAVKQVFNASNTLVATLNVDGQSVPLPPAKFYRIHETFTVLPGGYIFSATNTFLQSAVPEPASLAIWSLIGVGVAAGTTARRKRGWTPRSRQAICQLIGRERS